MKTLFQRHPATLLLAGACLLAALGLSLEYHALQRERTGILQSPSTSPSDAPRLPEPAVDTVEELPPIGTFSAFVERPLFVEGRQPLPAEPEAALAKPEEEKKPPPNVRLTGIIDTPEAGQIILIQDQRGKTLRLKPGETLDGWRLAEPADDHVVLEQDGESHTLQLVKPRPVQVRPQPRPIQRPPPRTRDNPFARAAARKRAANTTAEDNEE